MNVHPLNPIGMEITVKSPKVCFTVCRPRKTTPNLGESCTTVMFEGELEKATDMTYYGFSYERTNRCRKGRISGGEERHWDGGVCR